MQSFWAPKPKRFTFRKTQKMEVWWKLKIWDFFYTSKKDEDKSFQTWGCKLRLIAICLSYEAKQSCKVTKCCLSISFTILFSFITQWNINKSLLATPYLKVLILVFVWHTGIKKKYLSTLANWPLKLQFHIFQKSPFLDYSNQKNYLPVWLNGAISSTWKTSILGKVWDLWSYNNWQGSQTKKILSKKLGQLWPNIYH